VDTLARPFDPEDIPFREHMLAMAKLEAEGSFSESQIVLGWRIDTRTLLISLPEEKYNAWITEINLAIQTRRIESLVGRFTHCGTIIPMARFFIGDLRRHITRKIRKFAKIKLQDTEINTLTLWKTLLLKAYQGINLNLITLRRPTNIVITDACPTGIVKISSISSSKLFPMFL
jgi:hypothetical protein